MFLAKERVHMLAQCDEDALMRSNQEMVNRHRVGKHDPKRCELKEGGQVLVHTGNAVTRPRTRLSRWFKIFPADI